MSFALQARRSHHKKKTLSFRITSLSFSCGGVRSRTDVLRATSATLAPQKKDAILPNNVSFFFLWRSSESNRCPSRYKRDARTTKKRRYPSEYRLFFFLWRISESNR